MSKCYWFNEETLRKVRRYLWRSHRKAPFHFVKIRHGFYRLEAGERTQRIVEAFIAGMRAR